MADNGGIGAGFANVCTQGKKNEMQHIQKWRAFQTCTHIEARGMIYDVVRFENRQEEYPLIQRVTWYRQKPVMGVCIICTEREIRTHAPYRLPDRDTFRPQKKHPIIENVVFRRFAGRRPNVLQDVK